MLRVNDRISIPYTEFDFTFARSGGPGGQNVNKVNSKVTLRWDVTKSPTLPPGVFTRFRAKYHRRITKDGELVMTSQRYRDQGRNVADCLEKLRDLLLDVAVAPRTRRPTRRTKGSVQRRLNDKKQQSAKKQNRRRPSGED
ncbi:MAG: alternative ribosome rescue aminoacyl-tRNA hydrolase ArfB [Planctomycetales bacterium]|jgi:ribosome-associated protein